MTTVEFVRVVEARDADQAVAFAKLAAKAEGLRVRTLKSVRWERSGDMPVRLPAYRVTLAVEIHA